MATKIAVKDKEGNVKHIKFKFTEEDIWMGVNSKRK